MDEELRRSLEAFRNRRIYPDLNPMILATIEDEWLEQAIVDHVVGRAEAQGVEVADLLPQVDLAFSHVYATWITEAEVFNGGFNQYFFNSTGRLAPEAAAGYAAIGAPEREHIVRAAMQRLLDNSASLAPAWSQRTLQAFSASYELEIFGDLDRAFYAQEEIENASKLRVAFIRAHPEELTAG
jgi:Domain of unknown function (DUF4375)